MKKTKDCVFKDVIRPPSEWVDLEDECVATSIDCIQLDKEKYISKPIMLDELIEWAKSQQALGASCIMKYCDGMAHLLTLTTNADFFPLYFEKDEDSCNNI